MPEYRATKTRLKVNNKQAPLLAKHAGADRWAWNWGLTIGSEAIENKVKCPTAIDHLNVSGTLKNHRLASARAEARILGIKAAITVQIGRVWLRSSHS
jgi:hypothetical protein